METEKKSYNEIIEQEINTSITTEEDATKNFLMDKILGENFAVSVGNFIFIPPIENPKVSSDCREIELKQTSKIIDDYVNVDIKIDNDNVKLFIHKSRVLNENIPPSVSIYSIEKVNEKDLKLAFKNNFPNIFIETVSEYLNYKKHLQCSETKLLEGVTI